MVVLQAQKGNKLEDGKHTGKIVRIEHREKPFHYVDIFIKPNDTEAAIELKHSVPAHITENSQLGRIIKQFKDFKPKDDIDVDEILKDKEVEFISTTETTEKGTFARVVDGSIKVICKEEERA